MSGTEINFLPCDSNERTVDISALTSKNQLLVLGTTSSFSLLSEQFLADATSSHSPTAVNPKTEINVYAVGAEGNLVWGQLPIDLAVLAASPVQAAVIMTPAHLLENAADIPIHEWLVNQVDSLKAMRHLEKCLNTSIDYPALAPQISTMPTWLQSRCASFSLEHVKSKPDAIAIKAGLFQIYGELDRSHNYSQDCQGEGKHVAGDYWHGIMHRREPDYGNSKYWFRRVGDHPIFDELKNHAKQLLQGCESPEASEWERRLTSNGWDPFAFVDLCEACSEGEDAQLDLTSRQIQWREMMLLLAQTYRDAVS